MALSKKQQNWILKNRKLSPKKIAEKLNLEINEVTAFLDAHPIKPVPKYFYLVMFIIPIIFVVFLELSLRVFDYGDDYQQWVPVTDKVLGLNPDIGRKYFTKTKALPESIQDTFDKEKQENAFRVFVLGGSSAAGYPYMPLGSFSRYIDQRLKHVYPNSKIEVVNISLTAVNSYTIRDFIPGVIEQKPDLILIYAGHNEFYGALGIGSMESLGTSRDMVNLILYLNKYRITQLVKDFLSWSISLLASDDEVKSGTLMSRMAEDQSIPLNSGTYQAGIEQFRENIRDIIEMVQANDVDIIIGNLASNIKDQSPFISKETKGLPSATEVYGKAQSKLNNSNLSSADSLFRYAKDLDLLRFRAPEKFNEVILELANQYNFPFVSIDSALSKNSVDQIIGDDLMTDHLHPTLGGYQIIGDAFYTAMHFYNMLPKSEPTIADLETQDSITVSSFYFSKIDSIIADYKIKLLKNDWPYLKDPNKKLSSEKLLNPQNGIDSLAYKFVVDDLPWIEIQQETADYYLINGEINNYVSQMKLLIYQYPIIPKFYEKAVTDLITRNHSDLAFEFAKEKYQSSPDAFSTKWMGIILLSINKIEKAEKYLLESMEFSPTDEQVLYNLAGVYVQKKEYKTALEYSKKALAIKPNYQAAKNLKVQLTNALNQ